MSLQAEFEHAQNRLRRYRVIEAPFEHYMVDEFFTPPFYARLLEMLPDDAAYVWGKGADANEKVRGTLILSRATIAALPADKGAFWRAVAAWMHSRAFIAAVASKFADQILDRLAHEPNGSILLIEIKLVRDKIHYALRPHTDAPNRVTTLMVYLPRDERVKDFGTSLYVPKDPNLRCTGRRRHPFEDFHSVGRAPFLPNAGLGFLKSDQSFHGVELFDGEGLEREFLTFSIRCVTETWRQKARRLAETLLRRQSHAAISLSQFAGTLR